MTPETFGLQAVPFGTVPRAENYFGAAVMDQARQNCLRCAERAEGVAIIVGPPGSGKTMLLQVLANDLQPRFATVVLGGGQFTTRRSLLQAILYELQLPCVGREEGDLRLTLLDRLSLSNDPGLVILCDEAHTLPLRLLEELRLLTNVVRDGEPKVRLILAGNQQLEERLANPKLEALQQRISKRCYLHAWSRQETREYVRSQIYFAGGVPEQIFTSAALDAIFRATDGVPRLVNQICDHALLLAAEQGTAHLDKLQIETAWADLQQLPLPTPSLHSNARSEPSNVVEFGLLDEEPDAAENELFSSGKSPIGGQESGPTEAWELNEFQTPDDAPGPRLFAGQLDEDELEPEVDELLDLTADESPRQPFRPRMAQHDDNEETSLSPVTPPATIEPVVPRMLQGLQQVERQLSALHHDFQSLGTTTEVELSWPDEHPFQEAFIEEEVVLDPFLNQSLNIFANKPVVQSVESQALTRAIKDSLAQPVTKPIAKSAAVAAPPVTVGVNTAQQVNTVQPTNTQLTGSIELVHAGSLPESVPVVTNTAAPAQVEDQALADEELDLIVVEDDPTQNAASQPKVTRQEYRQLFARLRRS